MPAKPSKTEAVTAEVTTDSMPDPAWDNARQQLAGLATTARVYLYQQALFGWSLANLKKSHGVREGRPSKNSATVAEFLPWPKKVKAETGLADRTADRFIQLYERAKAKLKKQIAAGKKKGGTEAELSLSLLETSNPLAIAPEQMAMVAEIVASLCDGHTQGSLMQEIGVLPPPPPMPPGGGTKKDQGDIEQLAFHFFDGPASAIVKARAASDYHTFLSRLPLVTDEAGKVCLRFLHDETAAFLDDIQKAMASHAKPAGKSTKS